MVLGCALGLMFWMTIAAIWISPWWGAAIIVLVSVWGVLQLIGRRNHPLW